MKRKRARALTPDYVNWLEVRTRDGKESCGHQHASLVNGALSCDTFNLKKQHVDIVEITVKVRWSNYRKDKPGCPRCGRKD